MNAETPRNNDTGGNTNANNNANNDDENNPHPKKMVNVKQLIKEREEMDRLMMERLKRMQKKTKEMKNEMKATEIHVSKIEDKIKGIKEERIEQGKIWEARLRRLSADQTGGAASAEHEQRMEKKIADITRERREEGVGWEKTLQQIDAERRKDMQVMRMTEDKLVEMQNKMEEHREEVLRLNKLIKHSDDMDPTNGTEDAVVPLKTTVNRKQLIRLKEAMSEQLCSTKKKYTELKNEMKSTEHKVQKAKEEMTTIVNVIQLAEELLSAEQHKVTKTTEKHDQNYIREETGEERGLVTAEQRSGDQERIRKTDKREPLPEEPIKRPKSVRHREREPVPPEPEWRHSMQNEKTMEECVPKQKKDFKEEKAEKQKLEEDPGQRLQLTMVSQKIKHMTSYTPTNNKISQVGDDMSSIYCHVKKLRHLLNTKNTQRTKDDLTWERIPDQTRDEITTATKLPQKAEMTSDVKELIQEKKTLEHPHLEHPLSSKNELDGMTEMRQGWDKKIERVQPGPTMPPGRIVGRGRRVPSSTVEQGVRTVEGETTKVKEEPKQTFDKKEERVQPSPTVEQNNECNLNKKLQEIEQQVKTMDKKKVIKGKDPTAEQLSTMERSKIKLSGLICPDPERPNVGEKSNGVGTGKTEEKLPLMANLKKQQVSHTMHKEEKRLSEEQKNETTKAVSPVEKKVTNTPDIKAPVQVEKVTGRLPWNVRALSEHKEEENKPMAIVEPSEPLRCKDQVKESMKEGRSTGRPLKPQFEIDHLPKPQIEKKPLPPEKEPWTKQQNRNENVKKQTLTEQLLRVEQNNKDVNKQMKMTEDKLREMKGKIADIKGEWEQEVNNQAVRNIADIKEGQGVDEPDLMEPVPLTSGECENMDTIETTETNLLEVEPKVALRDIKKEKLVQQGAAKIADLSAIPSGQDNDMNEDITEGEKKEGKLEKRLQQMTKKHLNDMDILTHTAKKVQAIEDKMRHIQEQSLQEIALKQKKEMDVLKSTEMKVDAMKEQIKLIKEEEEEEEEDDDEEDGDEEDGDDDDDDDNDKLKVVSLKSLSEQQNEIATTVSIEEPNVDKKTLTQSVKSNEISTEQLTGEKDPLIEQLNTSKHRLIDENKSKRVRDQIQTTEDKVLEIKEIVIQGQKELQQGGTGKYTKNGIRTSENHVQKVQNKNGNGISTSENHVQKDEKKNVDEKADDKGLQLYTVEEKKVKAEQEPMPGPRMNQQTIQPIRDIKAKSDVENIKTSFKDKEDRRLQLNYVVNSAKTRESMDPKKEETPMTSHSGEKRPTDQSAEQKTEKSKEAKLVEMPVSTGEQPLSVKPGGQETPMITDNNISTCRARPFILPSNQVDGVATSENTGRQTYNVKQLIRLREAMTGQILAEEKKKHRR